MGKDLTGLKVGDQMPPFYAKDQKGVLVSDEDLVGLPLVIYFYQKNITTGSIKEANLFQKNYEKFKKMGAFVIGVSPDTVESHQKFIEEHNLSFSLFSDEKKDIFYLFGAIQKGKIIPSTFVIDRKGVIRWIEKPVELKHHISRVLKAVKEACQ